MEQVRNMDAMGRAQLGLGYQVPQWDVLASVRFTREHYTKDYGVNLIRAASRGSLQELQSLLDLGLNPDKNYQTRTPLVEAVTNGHVQCAEALLDAGAKPTYSLKGADPFMCAILADHPACMSLLMKRCNVNFNAIDHKMTTTLMYSARVGNFSTTQLVLQHCNPHLLYLNDDEHQTVVTYAAINGHKDYLRQLMPLISFSNELVKAAAQNEAEELRRLLHEGHNPNARDFGGLTALAVCAMLDHRRCLDALLEHRVSLNKWDGAGRMPIVYAAACGNRYCMERLIEKGATLSWTTREKESSLMFAARNGSVECAELALRGLLGEWRLLFSNRAVTSQSEDILRCRFHRYEHYQVRFLSSLDGFDSSGRNALLYACEKGHLTIVRMLLDAGACIHNRSSLTDKTPLMIAAASGHVNIVAALIEKGSVVDVMDKHNYTALYYAARNGHLPCIHVLLQAGAQICKPDRIECPQSALSIALDSGHIECVEALIDAMTPSQLEFMDVRGRDGISHAAATGSVHVIQLLLQAGLHLTSRDDIDNTPLMYATAGSYLECMKFLVEEMDVCVNDRNESGLNALGMAVSYSLSTKIVRYLIECGSDVNASNVYNGWSPLIYACRNNNKRHVRLLLSANADASHRDKKCYTALSHSAMMGHLETVRVILQAERVRDLFIPDVEHFISLAHAFNYFHPEIIQTFLTLWTFDWNWYPDIIDRIRWQGRLVINFLHTCGISPGSFPDPSDTTQYSSPIILALKVGDSNTVQYIVRNLYLTTRDYRTIIQNRGFLKKFLQSMDQSPLGTIDQNVLRVNPLSLLTLSFLTVSTAIGDHCGVVSRLEAVNSLQIPECLKRKLAFQECPRINFINNGGWENFLMVPVI